MHKLIRRSIGALIGIFISLLVLFLFTQGLFSGFNHFIFDTWFRIRAQSRLPDSNIILIGIDNDTLRKYKWPIERSKYTALFSQLERQKPAVIGFNIILSDLLSESAAIQKDRSLAEIIENLGNVVMPVYYDYSENNVTLKPASLFLSRTRSLGNASTFPDSDGITRYVEAQINGDTQKHWAFGIDIVRIYLGLNSNDLKLVDNYLHIAKHYSVPLLEHKGKHLLFINYLGPPRTFSYYPLHQILSGEVTINTTGKIVLIGSVTPGLADMTATPFGKGKIPMFGIEVQANLIDNLLNRDLFYEFPFVFMCFLTILMGALLGSLLHKNSFSIILQFFIVIAFSIIYLIASYILFDTFFMKFNTAPLIGSALLIFLAILSYTIAMTNIYFNQEIESLNHLYKQRQHLDKNEKLSQILNVVEYLTHTVYVRLWGRSGEYFEPIMTSHGISDMAVEREAISEKSFRELGGRIDIMWPVDTLPVEWKKWIPPITHSVYLMPYANAEGIITDLLEIGFQEGSDEVSPTFLTLLAEKLSEVKRLKENTMGERDLKMLPVEAEHKISLLSSMTRQIQYDREFFEAVLSSSKNPIFLCDTYAEIQYYNIKFLEFLQLPLDTNLAGKNLFKVVALHFSLPREQWVDIWECAFLEKETTELGLELQNHFYSFSLTPIIAPDGVVDGILGDITDITTLYKQATYDGLTGLHNRQSFNDMLSQEFYRCQRNPDSYFSLIIADIDYFKDFNDTYGHQIGDRVLKMVAEVLNASIRKTDFIARYGGEEIALILPMTHAQGASILAERLREKVAKLEVHDMNGDKIQSIFISIGLTTFHAQDPNIYAIIQRADEALYKSKEAGRNCGYALIEGLFTSIREMV